jgi:hypothetical protein
VALPAAETAKDPSIAPTLAAGTGSSGCISGSASYPAYAGQDIVGVGISGDE